MRPGHAHLSFLGVAFTVLCAFALPGAQGPLTVPTSLPTSLSDLPSLPSAWHVTASALADVTGDDLPEWVLLVWRPWRDWPIQRWSVVPSPIAEFHDAGGDSCHLILLDPQDGREIWAGSALPVPLLALVTEDVDGDGIDEIVTLEGSYARGRGGPGTHVGVWSWNGFGFTLGWRSPLVTFRQHCLTHADRCGMLDIAIADLSRSRRFR